jgi:pimeloyl-ACP methyl ester carboxylesterase
MPFATNGDIRIYWESFGDPAAPAILLVNGLGSQMTRWPEAFCEVLTGKGYRALRFDNRDAGLSTWFDAGGTYTLEDMAADAMAVLDAAGVPAAHVAGMSMGGMISQVIAADHADRTLSLTSIMSTSAAPGLPQATPVALAVLTQPTPDFRTDPDAHIAAAVENALVIGSPAYPWPKGELAARARAEAERAWNPTGSARQIQAVGATGDRSERLARITVPTVVLHGADDLLMPADGGRDTAAKISGAELRIIEGMGHDLPPALFGIVADAILAAAARAGGPFQGA